MYCRITQKKFQDVMSLVGAAVLHVALLWALHTSGCDSTFRSKFEGGCLAIRLVSSAVLLRIALVQITKS